MQLIPAFLSDHDSPLELLIDLFIIVIAIATVIWVLRLAGIIK